MNRSAGAKSCVDPLCADSPSLSVVTKGEVSVKVMDLGFSGDSSL